jgi:hypothetical protein
MSEKGGITKGKSHKEGGIPMVVKSTGQQVELEGGEGVTNKRNMASDTKYEFQGKQMTTCEITSALNSANGNGVKIDCDDVTGKKYAYENGGVVFIDYNENEIMYEPIDRKYYANDKEFDSLEDAQKFLDSGGVNEDLRGAYERGLFKGGGWILVDADTERKLGEYATESEARQMMYEYEGNGMIVQKSVWDKLPPNPNRHSPAFNFKEGGGVKDYNSLIGKYVNIYSMGVSLPTEHQIKDVMVSSENFRYRYVTLKFDLGIAPILLDEATAFMNNEIIYVNNNKEEFGIQLMPNQFGQGGGVDEFNIAYVDAIGSYGTDDDSWELITQILEKHNIEVDNSKDWHTKGYAEELYEEIDGNTIFTIKFNINDSENPKELKKEIENLPKRIHYQFTTEEEQYGNGGDVRDFSWYQDFKKQELKRGTAHEMEHIDTIREFKKRNVSDKEVAQAIAKDHLEEDENYYIELDKMESSRKLSEAINDFVKYTGYRKNASKFKHGGYMGQEREVVHIVFNEDFNGVIRKENGKYVSESKFPKDSIFKFTFKHNDGKNSTLEFANTGAYIIVPNNKINIVGFNENKYGNGGSVKPYQSIPLNENDKQIMKLLTKYEDPSLLNSSEKQKLSSFKGKNVVNELSSDLIQKIFGLLFQYHNVEHPIKHLFLSNVGAGNIVSYAPKYVDTLMIEFDEKNRFESVEREINSIVNQTKKYILFDNVEIHNMDAIIHIYPETNPDYEQLNYLLYQSDKPSIGLGVCEFTSKELMNEFQNKVSVNQGAFAQNQMMMYKQGTKFLNVKEGITDNGQYTLMYILHKMS